MKYDVHFDSRNTRNTILDLDYIVEYYWIMSIIIIVIIECN